MKEDILSLTAWFHQAQLCAIASLTLSCSIIQACLYLKRTSWVFCLLTCSDLRDFCASKIGKEAMYLNGFISVCLVMWYNWEVCLLHGVLFWKLTGFPLLFLCLTSCLAQSDLRCSTQLPSKIVSLNVVHAAERRAASGTFLKRTETHALS